MDRKRSLLEDGGPSTEDIPQKRSRIIEEQSLEERADQKPMDAEDFVALHAAIEDGDIEKVRGIVKSHEEEDFFSYDETSALYKAFQCKEYEIISFLIHKGAKFVGYEDEYVYDFGIDKDRLNHLLFEYNRKSDKSCIYRLMSLSQSPQDLDGERLNALLLMYEHFYRSDTIKLLMKVLESVDYDIVFDFESDKVNKVHRFSYEEEEIFGLTLSNAREIFVGANGLLSADPKKRAKVYGVVAEELCHLALTTVFKNNAKPYKEEDSKLIKEFQDIVLAVKAFTARSCHVASVIPDVFEYYGTYAWECELIARVPHLIGIYGENSGRIILQESSELYRLLLFYEHNVLSKCREYTDQLVNTKSNRIMKQLVGKNEFISFKEKGIRPLKEEFPSFRGLVVIEAGVCVLTTNCIKLCALQVYHELKPVYGDQLERKCLFFGGDCFEEKRAEILKALKCKLCEYFVLILDDKELHHRRFLCEYLDEFEPFKNEGLNVIIITNSLLLGPEFEDKYLEYNWDDLTDEYKNFRTRPLEYIFKGGRQYTSIKKENVPVLFSEDDITTIISGGLIEVWDGPDLHCQGYNPETYVERQLKAVIIEGKDIEMLTPDTNILIYGLCRWDFEELPINKSLVQWLEGPEDEIQKGKAVFISNRDKPIKFKHFFGKTPAKNCVCLLYDRKLFYLVSSKGDDCEQYLKKIRQSEDEIIDLLKSNRSLIISENAGCGKSTVMSSLIWRVKKKIYNSWVLRVDLNKFSIKDQSPNSEEDAFEDIFLMLGFESGFEKCHFMEKSYQDNYFIFLDAFDEILSEYKTKALKLISFLRRKTAARIMITTRLHHQQELEEILNTFSHQLVPFDKLSQVNCMGKLWKWKLKFPNGEGGRFSQKDKKAITGKIKSIIGELEKEKTDSESLILALKEIKLEGSVNSIRREIDGLEFNRFAHYILNKTLMDKETVDFMGIPLHLFMIGIIYFDSNFNVEIQSDLYGIYSKFVDQKILIYVEEKEGIERDGREKKETVKKRREDAFNIHIELSNQLFEKGKIDSNMREDDLELCTSLGIVFIKGAEVDFLHHTLAEFFKAESVRVNLNKKGFTDVIFDDKYNVVRKFLGSSLEGKYFENLTQEFCEDVKFVFDVLKRFVSEFDYFAFKLSDYKLDLRLSDSAKIVKRLLESYERTVGSDSLKVFVEELESKVSSWKNWHEVGCCLTVNMFKVLFIRKVDFEMISSMVKCYSNPEEVIEILNECVSIEIDDKSGTRQRNGSGCEKSKAERLLKVLNYKNSVERGILSSAVSNVRIEIFAKILEFSKDVLGEDQFFDSVIKGEEYTTAMNFFIDKADFNRICVLLKAFLSQFGTQMETFFDSRLKFRILKRMLDIRRRARRIEDELRIAFGEINNFFKGYFGIESLKEALLSCDSRGFYLIHHLVIQNSYLIEFLNIIKSIFGDRSKMKEFLTFKDGESRNLFHLVAKNGNIDLGEVLKYCSENLESGEVRDMLMSVDVNRENVLHISCEYNSSKVMDERFNLIKNTLGDEELFKKLLTGKDTELRNIFHFAASCADVTNISFLNFRFNPSEIKVLLSERSTDGRTCLHYGTNSHSMNLLVFLEYSFEMFRDEKSNFEELVLAEDEDGNTFLHFFVGWYCYYFREEFVGRIITSVKEKVSEDIFEKLLRVRIERGKTFLQIKGIYSEEIVKFFEKTLEKSLFEELLEKNENYDDDDDEDGDDDDDDEDDDDFDDDNDDEDDYDDDEKDEDGADCDDENADSDDDDHSEEDDEGGIL